MIKLITFLPEVLRALGGILKALFIYRAGKKAAQHDFQESLNEVLAEDAQDWANRPRSDDDVIDRLSRAEQAARKREARSKG